MLRVTISVACVLVIWMIALMSPDVSANQPQVSYDFNEPSVSGAARSLAPGP